ncbi:alpha/beta fold hydrolase [Pseudonocardia lacus]|uniref:alpha/beta fold hydrolase n=1 Tax=Pseudonocardia lacus TaxID=2835865 RepID=UPI001BDD1D18|nr:alpha/beta hydrolase [Pseudonocardia lacus]
MPYFDTPDGNRQFYKDLGEGPPVVLVHAWSLSSAMWEYQLPVLLGAGYRCVAMDRRGHGRSDQPATGYDLDTLADDLAALLDRLDLRDVRLVAHSMGTCEITRYLARHGSGRVSRAVYLGAMTPGLSAAVGPGPVEETLAALHADRPGWFREAAPAYFAAPGSGVSQALVDDGVTTILTTPLEVQTACLRTTFGTDLTADLAAVDVPALVVHGDADASAPIELTGRPTAKLLPDARFVLYPGAPHGLYVTERERLARDLLGFLAG